MSISKRGIVLAAAGTLAASIALGGSTLAYWSDEEKINNQISTSGDFQASTASDSPTATWTITPKSTGVSTAFTAGDPLFPEDVLKGVQNFDLSLNGDNLKVIPNVTLISGESIITPPADYTVTYRILDSATGAVIVNSTPINNVGPQTSLLTDTANKKSLNGISDIRVEVTIVSPPADPNPDVTPAPQHFNYSYKLVLRQV